MKINYTYPLRWPHDQEATASRTKYPWRSTWINALHCLEKELKHRKVKHAGITSNTIDGKIHPAYASPGVSVFFTYKGKTLILACDTYYRISDNLMAIAYTMKHQRLARRSRVIYGEVTHG